MSSAMSTCKHLTFMRSLGPGGAVHSKTSSPRLRPSPDGIDALSIRERLQTAVSSTSRPSFARSTKTAISLGSDARRRDFASSAQARKRSQACQCCSAARWRLVLNLEVRVSCRKVSGTKCLQAPAGTHTPPSITRANQPTRYPLAWKRGMAMDERHQLAESTLARRHRIRKFRIL